MRGFAGRYYMWPEEYALLGKYVDLTEGDYLEIGSMCGIIATSLAEKYPHRTFVCVDNFSEGQDTIAGEKQVFLQNVREHNLQNVVLVEGDSLEVVPRLNRTFDVAFIDGNHAYEYVLNDALNSYRWVKPGGFLVFHDYEHVESTTRAVFDFMKQTGAQLVEAVSSVAVVCNCPPGAPLLSDSRDQEPRSAEQRLEAARGEISRLQSQLNAFDAETSSLQGTYASLRQENRELRASLQAIENSAGWQWLTRWRRWRDHLAPEGTRRRRLYDGLLSLWRRSD